MHGNAQLLEVLKRRQRERAGERVPTPTTTAPAPCAWVFQHSLKRIDVAVDVIQREDVRRGDARTNHDLGRHLKPIYAAYVLAGPNLSAPHLCACVFSPFVSHIRSP